MSEMEARFRTLLEAVSFAARAHRHQIRKDGTTPYVGHAFRVSLIVRHVFGIDDPAMLTAALLHDTIEDTTTDFDDLVKHFGREVADWVALLTKDKRLPEEDREEAYFTGLARAPWQVQVCKMADLFDNVMDSKHLTPAQRKKTLHRSQQVLARITEGELPPPAQRALKLINQLLHEWQADPTA